MEFWGVCPKTRRAVGLHNTDGNRIALRSVQEGTETALKVRVKTTGCSHVGYASQSQAYMGGDNVTWNGSCRPVSSWTKGSCLCYWGGICWVLASGLDVLGVF